MRLDMKTRKALVKEAGQRYRRCGKGGKGRLLDEFVQLTGYNRTYAARVLKAVPRAERFSRAVRGLCSGSRGRKKKYTEDVLKPLVKLWAILNFPCGKRLVAAMDDMLRVLGRCDELRTSSRLRRLLLSMSAATADRLLAPERKRLEIKGRSGTRPGSLLKHKIPICTFADWDDARVGFLQIDLVGHDGGNSAGDFCQSLSATDVATGWTEPRGVRNKAQVWVFEALEDIREKLPFPLLGINSDSGSEFINDHLFRYCKTNHITFTRCRENRKNDNCYVEQKNYTAVRQTVGYCRYDTQEELELLNRIYGLYRLYANFFLPQMKLVEKIREGSKLKKSYDRPKTPYARALASSQVSRTVKQKLEQQYATLNPARLRRDMLVLQQRLYKLAASKSRSRPARPRTRENLAYASIA